MNFSQMNNPNLGDDSLSSHTSSVLYEEGDWFLEPRTLEIVDNINLENRRLWDTDGLSNLGRSQTARLRPNKYREKSALTRHFPEIDCIDDIEFPRDIYDIQVEDLHSKTQIFRLISSSSSVQSLIDKISDCYRIPPHELRLTLRGQELSNFVSMTIKEAGISHKDTIRTKLRLKGGGQALNKVSTKNSLEGLNYNFNPDSQILFQPLLESCQENSTNVSEEFTANHESNSVKANSIQSKTLTSNVGDFEDQNNNLYPLSLRRLPTDSWISNSLLRGGGKEEDDLKTKDYIQKFQDYLKPRGLYLREMQKDGNCLFRAVADQLENNEDLHQKYRNIAVDFMSEHEDRFSDFITLGSDCKFSDYIAKMKCDKTWGGHLELQAVSEALSLKIYIHQINQDCTIIGKEGREGQRTVNIAFHPVQEHFDSVHHVPEINANKLIYTKNGNLDRRCSVNRPFLDAAIPPNIGKKRKANSPLPGINLKNSKLNSHHELPSQKNAYASISDPLKKEVPALINSGPLANKIPYNDYKENRKLADVEVLKDFLVGMNQRNLELNEGMIKKEILMLKQEFSVENQEIRKELSELKSENLSLRTQLQFYEDEVNKLSQENKTLSTTFKTLKMDGKLSLTQVQDEFLLQLSDLKYKLESQINSVNSNIIDLSYTPAPQMANLSTQLECLLGKFTYMENEISFLKKFSNLKLSEMYMDPLIEDLNNLHISKDDALHTIQSNLHHDSAMEIESPLEERRKKISHFNGVTPNTWFVRKNSPIKYKKIYVKKRHVEEEQDFGTFPKRLSIPWKGKIIKPTYQQLKDFKGDLNLLMETIGAEDPSGKEKNYEKVKIEWKDKIMWATPYQILRAEGNISNLEAFLLAQEKYMRGLSLPDYFSSKKGEIKPSFRKRENFSF